MNFNRGKKLNEKKKYAQNTLNLKFIRSGSIEYRYSTTWYVMSQCVSLAAFILLKTSFCLYKYVSLCGYGKFKQKKLNKNSNFNKEAHTSFLLATRLMVNWFVWVVLCSAMWICSYFVRRIYV